MTIHEYGDEFFRPTNAAWKCPHCGVELYTVSCIQSHKARCTTKQTTNQDKTENARQEQLKKSLAEFKRKNGIT